MQTPALVAACVEAMSHAMDGRAELSVKHRLGVRDAATFDAQHDKQQTDDEAIQECAHFIETITQNSNVQKLQVHARLGLLGDFQPDRSETTTT